MILVHDASVVLKWLLEDPAREPDTARAVAVVESVVSGKHEVLQPPHWLAEVGAVLARESPTTAADDVEMLAALQLPSADDSSIYRRATELAIKSGQHLFDTLYHAVALERAGATFVTADEKYFSRARRYGSIAVLRGWS